MYNDVINYKNDLIIKRSKNLCQKNKKRFEKENSGVYFHVE